MFLSAIRAPISTQVHRRTGVTAVALTGSHFARFSTNEADNDGAKVVRPKSLSDVMTPGEKTNLKQGTWHDFVQVLNNKGKIQCGEERLIDEQDALTFPSIKARNLRGEEVDFPACRGNTIKLVGFSFKQFGFEMVPTWINPFKETFQRNSAVTTMQLCFIELSVLRYLHSVIEASVKSQVPEADHGDTLVRYGDVEAFVHALKIPNRVTGYAYLLDKQNKVRWIGSGTASDQELDYLYACTRQLLEEGGNTSKYSHRRST